MRIKGIKTKERTIKAFVLMFSLLCIPIFEGLILTTKLIHSYPNIHSHIPYKKRTNLKNAKNLFNRREISDFQWIIQWLFIQRRLKLTFNNVTRCRRRPRTIWFNNQQDKTSNESGFVHFNYWILYVFLGGFRCSLQIQSTTSQTQWICKAWN